MKHNATRSSLILSSAMLLGLLASNIAAADSTIIVKAGSHQLTDSTQYISGFPSATLYFDDRSTSALGIEYEWRFPKNFTVGGEISGFRQEWRSNYGTVGDLTTLNFLVNGKKYFVVTDWFNPYVGIGLGIATADFEGPGGSASLAGFAGQAMAGIEFRFKHIGIYTEVKQFIAQPEDDAGETIDISGTGIYGGLSIHF